jgi:predicted molibdopterin-dependent oxidoreductase YjgC
VDRIVDPWGSRTPYQGDWPVRIDGVLDAGVAEQDVQRWVQATSVLHSNGDAMDIAVKDGHIVGVRGRGVDRVNDAAPEAWVELNPQDAARLGVGEADLVEVASVRGAVRVRARVRDIRPGTVFIPFHYGYWDLLDDAPPRAANELTLTAWDPVSKQPIYKLAAVRVRKLASRIGEAGG